MVEQKIRPDEIERTAGGVIQHGSLNDRIYIMKVKPEKLEDLMSRVEELVERNNYRKIFAKVPASAGNIFYRHGFHKEAVIPRYHSNGNDCVFMSRFRDSELAAVSPEAASVLQSIKEDEVTTDTSSMKGYEIRCCTEKDIPAMVELYTETFDTYPFPIHEKQYIRDTMAGNVKYYATVCEGKIVGLASAEIDMDEKAVEMTDFAVDKKHRGRRLAFALLKHMNLEMRALGMKTAYTIARAISYGMNKTFHRAKYQFGGTLINNTHICGQIESMNVWSRDISEQSVLL